MGEEQRYVQRGLFETLALWNGEWKQNVTARPRRVGLADLVDSYGFVYRRRPIDPRCVLNPHLEPLLVNVIVRMGTNRVLANYEDVLYYLDHGQQEVEVLEVDCSQQEALSLRLHEIRRLKNRDWPRCLAAVFRELGDHAHDYTQDNWAEMLEIDDKSSVSKLMAAVAPDLWEQVRADEITMWAAYREQRGRDAASLGDNVEQETPATGVVSETDAILEQFIRSPFVVREACRRHPAGFFAWLRKAAAHLEKIEQAHGVPTRRRQRRKAKRVELTESTR